MAEELLKTSKLESIGVLAGGIAHDFNNLLTAIVGNLYLSKLSVDPAHRLYARLVEAEKACLRAQSLTQQLLTFARGGLPILKTCDIASLLDEWVGFALHGSNVHPRVEMPPDLWPVEADEGQLNQVINNLVLNAQQAMPHGGTATVTAENLVLGSEQGLPLAPGRYVRIMVADVGVGIPAEVLPKVFDPFFTTKSKGTGLGLTTSYAIIAKHKGHMEVQSVPDRGTTVSIYLPATLKPGRQEPRRERAALTGVGRVLFMDDEDAIRGCIGDLLQAAGYEVECVGDGAEAVARYRAAQETGNPFDVVILDLTVPGGMGGKEAIERLRALDPGVRAVVSSGYSNDPVIAQFSQHGFHDRLSKPYQFDALCQVLARLTNDREPPPKQTTS